VECRALSVSKESYKLKKISFEKINSERKKLHDRVISLRSCDKKKLFLKIFAFSSFF